MKKNKILICLIFIATVVFSCNTKNAKKEECGLKVIKYIHDFGEIKSDTVLKGNFIVQNVGDSTIKYKNVITECGCTTISIAKGDSIISNQTDTIFFS